jgi:hypothetical protein
MKKALALMVGVLFMGPLTVEAQLINYERRNKSRESPPAVRTRGLIREPVKEVEVSQTKPATAARQIAEKPREVREINVTTRVEQIYDLNSDGILQISEVEDMLRDVSSSVLSRGNFTVSSPALEVFDKDGDGQISRHEASAIRDLLDR